MAALNPTGSRGWVLLGPMSHFRSLGTCTAPACLALDLGTLRGTLPGFSSASVHNNLPVLPWLALAGPLLLEAGLALPSTAWLPSSPLALQFCPIS